MARLQRAATVCLIAVVVTGCARVKPHQRRILATDVMDLDADAREASMEDHVLEYREGSVGGRGGGGSGCGCN